MRRLLAGLCGALLVAGAYAVGPPSALGGLQSGDADAGFAHAREVRAFEFPRDHGPHPDFRYEWWYVTGNLQAATGERFGFELTFFRYALAPPQSPDAAAVSSQDASRWRTNQIYMAHFAITDVSRKRFRFAERYAREALGLAGAQAAPLRVWLKDWSLGEMESQWKLQAAHGDYALTLDLRPLLSPVLNGDRGLVRKSSTSSAASYYYSIPRIAVQGHITREGKASAVEGLAWLDREWGSGGLSESGWDWFALQLDDQSTLMFYALRNGKGSREPIGSGTWVAPDGSIHRLKEQDVEIDVRGEWTSPRGGRYPARWQIRVPSLSLTVDVAPILADQELDTRPRYWEGAVDVIGTRAGRAVQGRGYVELVGYARNPSANF